MDPIAWAAASLGVVLVTLAACYIPAQRVLRIDPVQSLRQE